jgi:hypothetical protein
MALHTHKEIEHLKKLGASPELAEAIVELHTKNDEYLITKGDLNVAIVSLKNGIHESKNDLKLEIIRVESALNGKISDIKGEIKSIQTHNKISLAVLLVLLGILIAPLIKPSGTIIASLIQYFI